MSKPFCQVPFITAFNNSQGYYRNCCSVDPEIVSNNETFADWWNGADLNKFRSELMENKFPDSCARCKISEEIIQTSFRTEINKQFPSMTTSNWPQRWNLSFGNVCNLACWSCSEFSSSVIQQHKSKLNLLPDNYVDPTQRFLQQWIDLKQSILKSYNEHAIVTLTLLGGEPLYNKILIGFLEELILNNLSKRTKLEIHTNGTVKKSFINKKLWNHVCTFVSIDAVGSLSNWIRYGSNWESIEKNLLKFKIDSDYVEIHCVLGILNIKSLPDLYYFSQRIKTQLKITTITSPYFMSLKNWDQDPTLIVKREDLESIGLEKYYDLIGSEKILGSAQQLKEYIQQFDTLRIPLNEFDVDLANALQI